MTYRLSQKASDDIIGIYFQGFSLFGADQADQYHYELETVFELLANNPKMARERDEITPPVRIHPHKAHLIIYIIDENNDILILRVRHAHEDWIGEAI